MSFTDVKSTSLRRIVRNDTSSNLQFDALDEAFKDFKSSVSAVIESNLKLLDEVPLFHNLHLEDLRKFLESQIRTGLSKDVLFEKAVEIGRYARNMFDSMDAYFSEIFHFHQELKKELHSEMFNVSKMFLNSDLPLSFVKAIGDSLLNEIDYVDVFDKEIRKERLDLIKYRDNRTKFKRVCEAHNLWVRKFDELRTRMERERVKLIWYVDFNNSGSVNEIFKDKTIKTSLLDKSMLHNFILNLQKQVQEMERLNASKMEIHSFLRYETDEGTRTLLRIMQNLSQQEGMK
ncbi:MAG: hypothetical protein QW270_00790 [Candidatus Bathyarchaeia archaeon]